ncbi:MAG: STAS domain-containing protein [Leptolyngbyaceae cyanobacterium bins.349]|nr:STAS domain-containing protein [Leptolyngbyaceae cyanobacterium bins.349]
MKLMNSEVKVIQPSGILNNSLAIQLCHEVDEMISSGTRLILVNLENISFIDSSGLGGLVNAFKATRSVGGRMVLCSVCEQARMLLEITGMDQVFEIFPNESEFQRTVLEAV